MSEQQLLRMAKRRLAILRLAEEATGNVALTCRYYGISRQVLYTWRQRYNEHGLEGLPGPLPPAPQVSPTPPAPKSSARSFTWASTTISGPAKIAMYPKRYYDIHIGHSGVWRVLKRLERNRLPAS